MGRVVGPPIPESEREFISKQHVFFIGSSPLSPAGHVNISPKSASEFRLIDSSTVCYLDYSGSGSETSAHIIENGRITVMFVAFDGPPKILRLYGKGSLVLRDDIKQLPILAAHFEGYLSPGDAHCNPGFRSVIVINVDRVATSCGYSIPTFTYTSERKVLEDFAVKKGDDGMVSYRALKNSWSIDGLPSVGQLLQHDMPSEIRYENGYIFAVYGGKWYQKLWTAVKMKASYSYNSGQTHRDAFFVTLGVLFGVSVTVLYFGKIRNK